MSNAEVHAGLSRLRCPCTNFHPVHDHHLAGQGLKQRNWWNMMKHDLQTHSFRKKSNGSPAASWSRSEVTTPFYTRLGWFKRRVVEIWIQGKLKSCTSQRRSQVTHRAGDVLINQFMSICWWASDHVFMFFLHVPQSCCSNIPGWFVSP